MIGTLVGALLWALGLLFAWPLLLGGLSWFTLIAEAVWLFVLYWLAAWRVGKWENRFATDTVRAGLPGLGAQAFDLPTLLKWGWKLAPWALLVVIGLSVFSCGSLDGSAGTAPPPAPAAEATVTDPAPAEPEAAEEPPAVCHPGNWPTWWRCDDWHDGLGERCRNGGCYSGDWRAKHRRLVAEWNE